jgi:hypothetical protein
MSQADLDQWKTAALALDPKAVVLGGMPLKDRVFEADGVAGVLRKLWEPSPELRLPGMKETAAQVPLTVAGEIESLCRAIRFVHTDGIFPTLPPAEVPALEARARTLISTLSNACELVLDDNVHEPADSALAAAKDRAEDDTRATRIQYLFDLAAVAEEVKERLATLTSFDLGWITEAREVAQKLSSQGPPLTGQAADPRIDLRNRLVTLLDQRVSKVRRAARYVFRDHPEVVRQVTSAYERKRRVEAKRRKKSAVEPLA